MWVSGVFVIAAYLAGSMSTASIASRALELGDPRAVGSGNPGTTNVLRHFGKKAAASTLVGDGLKGALPVFRDASGGITTAPRELGYI